MQRAERLAELLFSRQNALKHLNAFISTPSQESVTSFIESPYGNRPQLEQSLIAIKDNICTSDLPTTCASRGLDGYTPPYDATVVTRLKQAGALIAGKTNLDEFGMGSHSTNSAFGPVKTASGHSPGGSSGGSAVAVSTSQCFGAIGTDTGGSVRLPAAYTGIYGFKPSYGLISRWGVVAYANSLDTVGFFARHPMAIKVLFDVTNAADAQDPTNLNLSSRARLAESLRKRKTRKQLRFGIPQEYNTQDIDPRVRKAWLHTLHTLQAAGHSIHSVSLPSTRSALSAYYVLAPAEASSNLAKYDGVRYGNPAPAADASSGLLFANTRHHGFGAEVRRRILLGAYSLSAVAMDNYFIQAQKVRRLVKAEFDRVFALRNPLSDAVEQENSDEGVDAILCPTAPSLPLTLEEAARQTPLQAYAGDVFTVPASLAGLPAINVPVKIEVGPGEVDSVGMQVITQYGDDDRAIFIADMLNDLGVCKALEQ